MELDAYMSVELATGEIVAGPEHPHGGIPEIVDGGYYLPLNAAYEATAVAVVGGALNVIFDVTGYTVP